MSLFVLPKTVPVSAGETYPGCQLDFFATGSSTTRQTVYTDSAKTIPHANPVTSDAGGVFDPIWLDETKTYRVRCRSASGAELWDVDPYPGTFLTQSVLGQVLYPRTAAETAASVTPSNYAYPAGDCRRYGGVGDGATDDTTAVLDTVKVAEQGTPGYFPAGYTFLCSTWLQRATTAAIHLYGGGTLKNDGTDIFLQPAYAVKLDGLTFDAWSQVLENDSADSGTVTDLDIRDCSFLNIAGSCIDIETPVSRAEIVGNYFNACTNYCIRIGKNDYSLQDTWQRVVITHNTAINIDATSTNNASFALVYGQFADISHNYIEDVDSDTGECWAIYTKVRWGCIDNNRIYDLATNGASLFAINVKGNSRADTSAPQGYGTSVRGNTLRQATAAGTAIRLQNEDTIVGNNFMEGFTVGIGGSTGVAYDNQNISNNIIICPSTDTGVYGINLIGQVNGVVCQANTVEGGQVGIRIAASGACSQWSIIGNTISGATNGIFSNSAALISDVDISNNLVTGSTGDGIYVQYMDKVKIIDNQVTATSGDEVDFGGTDIVTGLSLRHRSELQTTDATVTTVVGIQVADNSAISVDVAATAMESDGSDRARYSVGALVYRDGGGATLQGSQYSNITAIESDATWGGPTITVSSNDALCRVTGVAAQTINWSVTVKAESVA